ncbi:hypothetical protein J3Q64DRAFT_1672605, partial [Phycomyces blakesleeanus]
MYSMPLQARPSQSQSIDSLHNSSQDRRRSSQIHVESTPWINPMMQDQPSPESRNYIMPRHTESSLSNPHQAHPPLPRVYNTPPLPSSKMNRAVIPSKRAAQNRAAQKAFRQRREQYVKDLEKRSGEMEHWKEEMDQLRQENKRLRETVNNLERRLAEVAGESMPSPASNTQSTIMPGNSRTGQDSHDNELLTQQSTEIAQDNSDNEE